MVAALPVAIGRPSVPAGTRGKQERRVRRFGWIAPVGRFGEANSNVAPQSPSGLFHQGIIDTIEFTLGSVRVVMLLAQRCRSLNGPCQF
jgi:hypothetical protein